MCNHPALVLTASHPKLAEFRAATSTPLEDFRHSSKLLALRQLLWDCGIGAADQNDGADLDGQVISDQFTMVQNNQE